MWDKIHEFTMANAELRKRFHVLATYVRQHPEAANQSDAGMLLGIADEIKELAHVNVELRRTWNAAITAHLIALEHLNALADRGFPSNDPGVLEQLGGLNAAAERALQALDGAIAPIEMPAPGWAGGKAGGAVRKPLGGEPGGLEADGRGSLS